MSFKPQIHHIENPSKASNLKFHLFKWQQTINSLGVATLHYNISMALFSFILRFFLPSSSKYEFSSDDAGKSKKNLSSSSKSDKHSKERSKSSEAPIIVSYFPLNSKLSRL